MSFIGYLEATMVGRTGGGQDSVVRQVIAGILTAIVLAILGWLGNVATQGGLISFLGGVTKSELPTQIAAQLKKLDIKDGKDGAPGPAGPQGPPGTFTGTISFEAVRCGQSGCGKDEGARFVQLTPQAPQRFTQVATFPICTISEIDAGTINNEKNCNLRQLDGDWAIEVTGYTSCKVTCFKPVLLK
jgi:hypothetical protein